MSSSKKYHIQEFKFSDANINSFVRSIVKPQDCVINAIELLGVLDPRSADIARIMVGDTGVSKDQIEQIFNYVIPHANFIFDRLQNMRELMDFTKSMKSSHAILCGYTGHVFLIAKKNDGTVWYIDPMVNQICELSKPNCLMYIDNKQDYYALISDL